MQLRTPVSAHADTSISTCKIVDNAFGQSFLYRYSIWLYLAGVCSFISKFIKYLIY
jgi:hypothetical protein